MTRLEQPSFEPDSMNRDRSVRNLSDAVQQQERARELFTSIAGGTAHADNKLVSAFHGMTRIGTAHEAPAAYQEEALRVLSEARPKAAKTIREDIALMRKRKPNPKP